MTNPEKKLYPEFKTFQEYFNVKVRLDLDLYKLTTDLNLFHSCASKKIL